MTGLEGFTQELPEDAHPEWTELQQRHPNIKEHFWHVVVSVGDLYLDLTGSQYGSYFNGIRIMTEDQIRSEWNKVKDEWERGS